MSTQIRIPDIGDVDNVEVIELCVAEGDVVGPDDPLIVVESDKASMEVPAGASGTVLKLTVAVGDAVAEGDVIAELEAEGAGGADQEPETPTDEDTAADSGAPGKSAPGRSALDKEVPEKEAPEQETSERKAPDAAAATNAEAGRAKAADAADSAANEQEPPGSADAGVTPAKPAAQDDAPAAEVSDVTAATHKEVYASPSIRRLAREFGVELSQVNGSGDKGRIVREDVQGFVKSRLQGGSSAAAGGIPPVPVVDFSKFGEIELQPLGRTRAAGAANLHRSWLNLPHVTNHDEADVSDLEDFRKSLQPQAERKGIKVTPLAFIIKACTVLLKEFPTVNASLDAGVQNYILKRYVNVGIAVDTPNGLVVPVIMDADKKGIWELSAEIIDLAERARERKLKPAEMQGGTFSVSSLGAIGGTGFTPIINAPEVAILGVSRMTMRPQWDGSAFQPRKMLPLSLSYDHRAINGAEAGAFLTRLRELLGDFRQVAL